MNILVTGHKGMLGTALSEKLSALKHIVIKADLPEINITNVEEISDIFTKKKIDFIYNCAAYTNVDRCEEDYDTAYLVNAAAVKILADLAAKYDIPMVHISTDYVFNGVASKPYAVDHAIEPLSAYGKTKAAGEKFLQETVSKYFLVRTAWLYGHNGKNFVETIIASAKNNTELKIVDDQKGAPTYVDDLVDFLIKLLNSDKYGVYHYTNSGETTWYQFAKQFLNYLQINVKIIPCSTAEYPRPAKRPSYSVLDLAITKKEFKIEIPSWQDGLKRYLDKRGN
jgi:dTDP-4-dehydrorhamnose reductase